MVEADPTFTPDDLAELQAALVRAEEKPFTEPDAGAAEAPEVVEAVARVRNPSPTDQLKQLIHEDPALGAIVYDVVLDAVCLHGPVPWDDTRRYRRWTDSDSNHLFAYIGTEYGRKDSFRLVEIALDVAAHLRRHDPLKHALDTLPPWDGAPRVGHMLNWYLGAADAPYTSEVESLLYDAIVRRVYEPGCKFDYMPVVIGPQGLGKSTFLSLLVPDDGFFTDCVPAFDGAEFAAALQGRMVVEVSELAALKPSGIEAVKAAITRSVDTYRAPYARHFTDHPRRCILVGTTNTERFLVDETGNRRFLPITCGTVRSKRDLFGRDARNEFRLALAEAVAAYKGGRAREGLVLAPAMQDKALLAQAAAYLTDPRVEEIGQWLETAPNRICTTQIWREALGGDRDRQPTRYEANDIHSIMRLNFGAEWSYSGQRKARIAGYGVRTYYERIGNGDSL